MVWEHDLLVSLQSLRSPFMDWLMAFLSDISHNGYLFIGIGVVLLFFRKTRKIGIETLLSIALAYILANLIIKNIVARPRPYMVFPDLVPLVPKPHDTSFPSGHTVIAFAASTAIFLNRKKIGILALIFAAAVGFSRLYNQVHFPTDVLAGAVIGVVMAMLVHYFVYDAAEKGVRRLMNKKKA